MKAAARSRRDRIRAQLADLKMPGAGAEGDRRAPAGRQRGLSGTG